MCVNVFYVVLPPIPTAGLTASDVGDLAKRVREQMLEALYEISGVVPTQIQDKEEESSMPTVPSEVNEPAEVQETAVDEKPVPAMQVPLTIDTSRRDPSEKSLETEEDEGMVLVGRPDTDSL